MIDITQALDITRNKVFHAAFRYLKIALMPLMAFTLFMAASLPFGDGLTTWIAETFGLDPVSLYRFLLLTILFGMAIAMAAMLIDGINAFETFSNRYPEKWLDRYFFGGLLIAVVAFAVIMGLPSDHSALDPKAPVFTTTESYHQRALLRIAPSEIMTLKDVKMVAIPGPHTIVGRAIITQTAPNTYQVRMLR
ncbi:hypothetical protein [Acidithiobacillus ferrianus]|uniref:hypothetical protein n=1 Tax=Acidithiobacillus ferrianus TaxID=2678518 RepID=UPI0034E612C3